MIYEITISVPTNEIDGIIEKLNEAQIYNTFYNVPIEIIKNENGYGYLEKERQLTELKVYADDSVYDLKFPEDFTSFLSNITNIDENKISYEKYQNDEKKFKLEDIDLENHWMISYSLKDYPEKNVLYFAPQAAFGTGLHVTTQECLKIILSIDFKNLTVLDLGTGSGILSIGAAIKNAKSVVAIDIEPVERELMYNAKLNNISNITCKQMDLLSGESIINGKFDWAFMNIGASETLQILDKHHLLDKKINNFIISGLVEWNYEKVLPKFKESGYRIIKETHTDDWVTILLSL